MWSLIYYIIKKKSEIKQLQVLSKVNNGGGRDC